MTFGEHLEELRSRLIRSLIGLGVAVVITATFGFRLVGWMARPLLEAQYALGFQPQTYSFSPTAGFMDVYLTVTLISAVILAAPWVLYQLWCFVATGLYDNERRVVHLLWPFSVVMSALGIGFTYYILLPIALVFFLKFSTYYPPVEVGEPGWLMRFLVQVEGGEVAIHGPGTQPSGDEAFLQLPVLVTDPVAPAEGQVWINGTQGRIKALVNGQVRLIGLNPNSILSPMPEVGQYIKFASMMTLGIVIAFQMPVVMMVVGWTRLVDPSLIAKGRKYAFFVCFVIGAALTPADPVSMFVLAVPLYALFELGLMLMRKADRGIPDDD